MYPFTKPKPIEKAQDDILMELAQINARRQELGASYISTALRETFDEATLGEYKETYAPFIRVLADILVVLNEQEGLSAKVQSAYGSSFRIQANKADADILSTTFHENDPHICVILEMSHEQLTKVPHVYETTKNNNMTMEFVIYRTADEGLRLSFKSRLFHDHDSYSLESHEAMSHIMKNIIAELKGPKHRLKSETAVFKVIDQRFAEIGHRPVPSQAARPVQGVLRKGKIKI